MDRKKSSPQVGQLIEALGKDLQFNSKEIAEVIWLALERRKQTDEVEQPEPIQKPEPKGQEQRSESRQQSSPPRIDAEASAQVIPKKSYPGAKLPSGILPIQVPDAPVIRYPLDLARALRPLTSIRHRGDEGEKNLDEIATAEATAKQSLAERLLPVPVYKSLKNPYFDLVLVIDESQSMIFWRGVIDALQEILKHYGVFRNVIYGQIKPKDDESDFQISLGKQERSCHAKEFIDSGGRRLILVASDCVSDYWHNGKMLEVLKIWSKAHSLAIVQMLPDWLWLRTALGLGALVKFSSLNPLPASQDLSIQQVLIWTGTDVNKGVKVPVIALEPKVVRSWSEMVIGKGNSRIVGFVFDSNFVPRDSASSETLLQSLTPEERMARFRESASALARKLASLLAASPVITLPVVRLIQETLLPQSAVPQIAEVFLGGLLKPREPITPETHPDEVVFIFVEEGIRDIASKTVMEAPLGAASRSIRE